MRDFCGPIGFIGTHTQRRASTAPIKLGKVLFDLILFACRWREFVGCRLLALVAIVSQSAGRVLHLVLVGSPLAGHLASGAIACRQLWPGALCIPRAGERGPASESRRVRAANSRPN